MSQVFDRLLETFYRSWFRFHPDLAVEAGVQGYADRLPPVEDSDVGALISLEQKMLSSLDELGAESLDPERRLDRELLGASLSLALYEHDRQDWRYRDPLRFLPLEALNQLLVRPVEHFREGLLARLEQVPDYLRAARSFLLAEPESVPRFWVELAIGQVEAGGPFLRALPEHPKVRQQLARPEHLRRPVEAAARALAEFGHFLARDVMDLAEAHPACGGEYFERLLRQRHFLDVGTQTLRDVGKRLEAEAQDALGAPSVSYTAGEKSLQTWRLGLERARERLDEQAIVSLPGGESPRVLESPGFLRMLRPLPDYLPPVPGDSDQAATLYVGLDREAAPLDEAELDLDCWRMGWPGRHLQALRANRRWASASLPRLMAASSLSVLGWGEYCEELMLELKQGVDAAAARARAVHHLRAAIRLQLDVALHTEGLPVEAAMQRLTDEGGMSTARARAEVAWISRAPAQALGQALGAALLQGMREQQSGRVDSLRAFHDRLLEDGPIPLPLLFRRLGGEQGWGAVRESVFGSR